MYLDALIVGNALVNALFIYAPGKTDVQTPVAPLSVQVQHEGALTVADEYCGKVVNALLLRAARNATKNSDEQKELSARMDSAEREANDLTADWEIFSKRKLEQKDAVDCGKRMSRDAEVIMRKLIGA